MHQYNLKLTSEKWVNQSLYIRLDLTPLINMVENEIKKCSTSHVIWRRYAAVLRKTITILALFPDQSRRDRPIRIHVVFSYFFFIKVYNFIAPNPFLFDRTARTCNWVGGVDRLRSNLTRRFGQKLTGWQDDETMIMSTS